METSLSAKDICTIIKASKESGVQCITTSGLTIEFYPRRNEASDPHRNAETVIRKDEEITSSQENLIPSAWKEQAELFDKEAISDAEEAMLMLDDPMAYEKNVVSRDIERSRVMNDA